MIDRNELLHAAIDPLLCDAREITAEPQGCGLDGVLRARATVLSGILNGVDYEVWNPASDRWLPTAYDLDTLSGKSSAKSPKDSICIKARCRL